MLRRAALFVVVLAAVVAVGTIIDLLRIRADLDRGRHRLSELSLDDLRGAGLEATLADAASSLRSAADRAHSSPFLDAVGATPVAETQIRGLRDITAATDRLGEEALVTGRRIGAALDRTCDGPPARVALLDVVLEELDRIEGVAADVDVGGSDGLVGPLADARDDVIEALDAVPERFDPLVRQVRALRALLDGPSSYLVMVGNNAEMRAGAGMPLSVGVASISGGDIELGDFKAATTHLFTLEPTGPHNAHIPAPLEKTYPRWMIGKDFPETAVVPDFPVTAPIFADIAADTQGWRTQGAIHIDALALAELLRVVGPVTVGGVEFTADNAAKILLNELYIAFEGRDHGLRREVQGEVAKALFEAIEHRDVDILDIVDALQRAAAGRHLMVWSEDRDVQEVLESFGASGDVSPFHTLVSVQNTAANKLDWYIRPSVDVVAEPLPEDDEWLVTMTITVSHPRRPLTASYIEGPFPELSGGRHRTLVTAQLPAISTAIEMPDEDVSEYGYDGTSWVIGTRVVVARGEDRQIVVRFRMPKQYPGLAVLPSARVAPVEWTVEGREYADGAAFLALFGEFHEDDGLRTPVAAAAGLVAIAGAGTGILGVRRRRVSESVADDRRATIDLQTSGGLVAVAILIALATLLV